MQVDNLNIGRVNKTNKQKIAYLRILATWHLLSKLTGSWLSVNKRHEWGRFGRPKLDSPLLRPRQKIDMGHRQTEGIISNGKIYTKV